MQNQKEKVKSRAKLRVERGPKQIKRAQNECKVKSDEKLMVKRGSKQIKRAQKEKKESHKIKGGER